MSIRSTFSFVVSTSVVAGGFLFAVNGLAEAQVQQVNYCSTISYGGENASVTCYSQNKGKSVENSGTTKTLTAICSPKAEGRGLVNAVKVSDKKVVQPGWSVNLQANCPSGYKVVPNSAAIS